MGKYQLEGMTTQEPAAGIAGDRMDLPEVWLLLKNNAALIAAIAGLVLTVIVIATMASPMKFKARGSLYLGELQNGRAVQTTVPDQLDFMGSRNGDVGTEIEILRSQDLVKRAILTAGLNVTIAPSGWSAPRYLHWRLVGRDLTLLDAGARRLVATNSVIAGGAGLSRDLEARFLADGSYELWNAGKRVGSARLGQTFRGSDERLGTLEITLLPGPDGPPAAGSTYTLAFDPIDQVAEEFAKVVNVSVPKTTGPGDPIKVVAVDFVHASPRAAARFVDGLMRSYLDRRQSWKTEEASVAETFVIGQVGSVKQALDEAEKKLAEYRKSSNVVALGDESKGMIEQIGKYEQQRVAAQLQVATFSQIQGLLAKRHAPIEQYLVGETDDPVLASLSSGLAAAQQELRRIQERFTPDAPAAHEQQAQVAAQLAMVKNYVLGRFTRAKTQLESLNQMIAQFEDKLKTVPHAELDLAQLTRDTDVLSKTYAFLLERQQQAALTKASTIPRNRVLDPALVPYREDSPAGGMRIIVGTLLGLLLGMLFVIGRRVLAPTFQTDREMRRGLGELPVFAAIPLGGGVGGVRRHFKGIPGIGAKPAPSVNSLASDPRSGFSEAFRHLRTNIYYAMQASEEKVLLIASPSPGDGKTLCTLALAAALAADDKQVLVIEADMHKPSHHGPFSPGERSGLSSVLSRHLHWNQAIRRMRTRAGTFDVIGAGPMPPSPAELLSGSQLRVLLDEARKSYDFILIDSPPYPLVSDALTLSRHADRVISVLRPRNTQRRPAEEHLRRLSSVAARFGVVINDADATDVYGGYGYSEGDRLRDMIANHAPTAR